MNGEKGDLESHALTILDILYNNSIVEEKFGKKNTGKEVPRKGKETKIQGRKIKSGKGIGKENMGYGKETGR